MPLAAKHLCPLIARATCEENGTKSRMECFQTSWLPGSQRASGKGDSETWMGPIAYDFLIALGQSRAWDSQPAAGRILGQRPGPQGCRFIRGGRSFGRDWQHGAF